MRVTDIVLQGKFPLGVQLCIEIGNESDGYHLTEGGYLRDAGRFCIGIESGGIVLQGGYSMICN